MRADAVPSAQKQKARNTLKGISPQPKQVYELWPGATESVDPHAFDDTLGDDIRAHKSRYDACIRRTKAGTLELLTATARGRVKLTRPMRTP